MRVALLIVVSGLLLLTGNTVLAQQKKLSLEFKHTPLEVVIYAVFRADTSYAFSLPEEMPNPYVDLKVKDLTLLQALDVLFADLPLSYKTAPYRNGTGTFVDIINDPTKPITGKITDSLGRPLTSVTVCIKGTSRCTITNEAGNYRLRKTPNGVTLEVGGVNIVTKEVPIDNRCQIDIVVAISPSQMTVTEVLPNGILVFPKFGLPVSVSVVDSTKINDLVSTGLTDRVIHYMNGLVQGTPSNQSSGITIRGWSTFYGKHDPQMVVDKFPYPGNPSDLNPNDIQTSYALKDVGATNIYGLRSANGILLYSTAAGSYSQTPHYTFTLNTIVVPKPDLSTLRWMTPRQYADFETQIFNSGFYQKYNYFNTINFPSSPILSILQQESTGTLDKGLGQQMINRLQQHSTLDDLKRYFYQTAIIRQAHLSFSEGDSADHHYDVSVGYDYNPTSYTRNSYERFTLHGSYTAHPFTNKLETILTANLVSLQTRNNNTGTIPGGYTYASLKGSGGQYNAINYLYNNNFLDTVGHGAFYDWRLRPLQELALADQQTNRYAGYVQAGLTWQLHNNLSLAAFGQVFKSWSTDNTLYDQNSFYVRNLVNLFSQTNGAATTNNIPYGPILYRTDTTRNSYDARLQLTWHKTRVRKYDWMVYAGTEVSSTTTQGMSHQEYDYGRNNPALIDYNTVYTTSTGQAMSIPDLDAALQQDERYLSTFASAYYINHYYSVFATGRLDASNFMGVQDPHKWAPFWSAGATVNILNNRRKHAPVLQWKFAIGCNGNVSNRVSWLTVNPLGNNVYGNPQLAISNPPDVAPEWERVMLINTGLQFSFFRSRKDSLGALYGTIDLYHKQASNLLGQDSLAPSAGYPSMLAPSAGIKGHGIDVQLTIVPVNKKVIVQTTLLFSFVKDIVSKYGYTPLRPDNYVTGLYPKVGHAPDGVYSYKSAGLEHDSGDPQGYLHGQVSKDYSTIMADSGGAIVYNGSALPTLYGSCWNSIRYKNWELDAGVTFKGGYSIRLPTIDWTDLLLGQSHGDKDYARRWQTPGNEMYTTVPSMPSVLNPNRDVFYGYSSDLVTSGAAVRLQDLRLAYSLLSGQKKTPMILYLNISNVALLWKANHAGVDPDQILGIPVNRTYALGCRITFFNKKP